MINRLCCSGLDSQVAVLLGLHPAFDSDNRPLVVLSRMRVASPFDCIALVLATEPNASVLRVERTAGLVEDPTLAGVTSPECTVAHWLVRLAAIEQRIGLTEAIIVSVPASSSATTLLRRLEEQGAFVLWPKRLLN